MVKSDIDWGIRDRIRDALQFSHTILVNVTIFVSILSRFVSKKIRRFLGSSNHQSNVIF